MTDPKSAQTLNNPNECDIPHLNTYKKRRSSHKGKVTVFKNYLESLTSKKPLSDLDIIQLRNRLESYKYLANEFDKNQTLIDDITGVSDEQLREREQFEMDYQSQLALGIHLLRENETAGVDGSVPTPSEDLTTESYIAAINRFISRRGKPNNIYSDNGKNLVGAARMVTNFLRNHGESIYSCAAEQGVNFHFIPPYSPHFGGLWESTVKSVKHHLKRVLGMAHLTYEEMYTLLVQIEGILNSRPLTPLSSDPNDLSALTPFHFLIGRTLTVLPHPQMSDCDTARLPRHHRIELLRQHFWRRFNKEYISQLHQRTRWQRSRGALTEGSLVIVKDEALPVAQWPLGRIVKLYPGHDGEARVADIKVKTGTIRRAFHKICPLLDVPSD
ncbi:uncharacterized protein LOC111358887 isoform X4 [Spodoptera litura]|uniref:Uncharacterized protein LOC111354775 isoform X4 n=1 Tax=Spodoptera litura TaxID=69820 RepID=A0A9J7IUW1_SPOLT|nr:uncharacterized protein LOC111354775 isoform X4 [Spodoptera litura]XP_022830031.1 uncharacterized protein LOC111358887 isoform X4 [Spodoptera litura]